MNRCRGCRLSALIVVVSLSGASVWGGGLAVDGRDVAEIRGPASALVEDYTNAGYSVRVKGGTIVVEVDLAPIQSHAPFEYDPPSDIAADAPIAPIQRLAGSLVADASTELEAASRILDWVSRQVRYDSDRSRSQAATAVLKRRSGFCTGVAKLTVAMLEAVGLSAREVPGYVASSPRGEAPRYHRWVEIRFSDRGWVFSDPLRSHHYVAATYVRLASERLLPDAAADVTTLLARLDQRRPIDVASEAATGITVRRNEARQRSASLGVLVEASGPGRALLRGEGGMRDAPLRDGRIDFVGLEPGRYDLTVLIDGEPPRRRHLVFRDRIRAEVSLR